MNVRDLPFRDGTFDFIYAGHLVEHLYYDRVPEYLDEWRRVLRPNGRLTVVVPDVGTSMRRYAAGTYTLDHVLPQIFGQYYSWDFGPQRHCYAYDYPRLVECLTRVPWQKVSRMDFGRPPEEIVPHIGRRISTADWQMGVVLTK
jgi:ubiquinone/menaquinone biosynthesis C-methylase UbiE